VERAMDPKGLDIDGIAIREQMQQQQLAECGDAAEVDYLFEIPLEVVKSLVGFKHDEICPHLIGGHFEVMSRVAAKSGFLSNDRQ
jgi:hypothetical protein